MGWYHLVLLFCFFHVGASQLLQSSQVQVLLQLRKHLEYPWQLEMWADHTTNFCSSSHAQVNLTCLNGFVSELEIVGDNPSRVGHFNGFALPNQTLSDSFSMDSFAATLARLTSLRVLRLVSLGIWGPLPDKIHRLFSLEHLDLSSNFLFGSIPPKISTMVNLGVLALNDNFFNSTVPNSFGSSTGLTILSLRNNRLKGTFPSSILSTISLSHLDMSTNDLSGRLPDFSSLTSLRLLNMSGNKFDSALPAMPKWVTLVSLSNNSFSGEIPKHYRELSWLQQLDISFNRLEGTLPALVFSLPNVSYLNLASNMFSGSLSDSVECSSTLRFVDMSNNVLTGGLPSCLRNDSETGRVVKFGGNCLSINNKQNQHAVSHCKELHAQKKQSRVGILVLVGVIFAILALLGLVFLVLWRRFCPRGISEQHFLQKTVQDNSIKAISPHLLTNARFISQSIELSRQHLPKCQSFSFEELKEATNNFDNSHFMGESLYGKIYRGKLENGTQVAIRCLPLPKKYSIRNLKLRLDLLAKLCHAHLVCLLGHCIHGTDPDDYKIFLITEYMPNGNFRTFLSGNNTLGKVFNYSERLAVLIGIAKAVHFLHTGIIPGFFNNRLKTNNILLNEQWIPKLSDYGLSIISEDNNKCVQVRESPKSWHMTKFEDDVYSFGFILLEALVGPSASTNPEQFLLNEMGSFSSQNGYKRIVDPIVHATGSPESLWTVISLTNKCISPESASCPSIEDVLWNLQYAAQVQATADADHRSCT